MLLSLSVRLIHHLSWILPSRVTFLYVILGDLKMSDQEPAIIPIFPLSQWQYRCEAVKRPKVSELSGTRNIKKGSHSSHLDGFAVISILIHELILARKLPDRKSVV